MKDDRRNRRWPFFDPFDEDGFDREFDRMRSMMERMMENYRSGEDSPEEPLVYGFTYRRGNDGVPYFEEFGNAKRFQDGGGSESGREEKSERMSAEGRREPMTDVIAGDKEVCVTIELPGVDRKNIKLDALDDLLVIDVDDESRKYYKEIALPTKIVPGSARATYKNGVLDVVLEKSDKRKQGRRIEVE